jgi:hypothetical protein
MKANLRLVGIIVSAIGFGFFVYFAIIIASALPEYNYSSYTGFRVPDWLYLLASLFITAGLWLIVLGNRKKNKQTPS